MAQLKATSRHVDHFLFGTSSGGTQAGIVLGSRIRRFHRPGFTGLSIDKNDPEHFEYETEVAQIANDCAAYIGLVRPRLPR